MRRIVLLCLLSSISAALSFPAAARDCRREAPLPNGIELTVPAPDVPGRIARFAGIWNGLWKVGGRDERCSLMVVERVYRNGYAELFFSYGIHPRRNNSLPGHFRAIGRVSNGVLRFARSDGKEYVVSWQGGTLSVRTGNNVTARYEKLGSLDAVGCAGHGGPNAEPATAQRVHLTAEQLFQPARRNRGPVHGSNFRSIGRSGPARHAFSGHLEIAAGTVFAESLGCTLSKRTLPAFTLTLFSSGEDLVPVDRGYLPSSQTVDGDAIIVSPGTIWSEPGDGGYSRAALPFVLLQKDWGAHNGVLTFLFNDTEVSHLHFQIVQETDPEFQYDVWGSLTARYRPGTSERMETAESA